MLKQFQVKNESLEKERLEAEFCGREGARVMAGLSSAVELTIDRMGLEGRLLSRRQICFCQETPRQLFQEGEGYPLMSWMSELNEPCVHYFYFERATKAMWNGRGSFMCG